MNPTQINNVNGEYSMSNVTKAKELFAKNPQISTKDFVKALQEELGMSLMVARVYASNTRKAMKEMTVATVVPVAVESTPVVKGKKAKKTTKMAKKVIEAVKQPEIADIKKVNSKRKAAAAKPVKVVAQNDREAAYEDKREDFLQSLPGFDANEAREEVNTFLRAEGFDSKPELAE